ncbi:hypothetical protein [Ectropis obliqua nucleopolyhedrovirus]|uniref:Ac55 n=1 Tax=Ectropis obliqua nucleopolyhedrovirus TaxID=59376 RepID=A0EYU3_9ABAC|nr:hypothetical protein EONV_gp040 [Ectropis obliqua nucleopolyhedrovirus]ABI35724.1 hypothetical protein [Ectropis obliqua nucleopolyhedrovirus]AGS47898.1 hypothetical protein wdlz-06GM52 [Ectropis obliqua nucleopolyhedrovirus]QWV59691.1 hypothetical protein EONV_gp040 [Ectropis obliqua nucleopolyhedrovirus]UYO72838.1 hypothetical protein EONV-gp040 [Ectropis obliqua nucleopolyhedrovirus]
MSQLNIKLSKIIDGAVDSKIKKSSYNQVYYDRRKEDVKSVGKATTYDVVGQRNYASHFNEKKYKF